MPNPGLETSNIYDINLSHHAAFVYIRKYNTKLISCWLYWSEGCFICI